MQVNGGQTDIQRNVGRQRLCYRGRNYSSGRVGEFGRINVLRAENVLNKPYLVQRQRVQQWSAVVGPWCQVALALKLGRDNREQLAERKPPAGIFLQPRFLAAPGNREENSVTRGSNSFCPACAATLDARSHRVESSVLTTR